MIINGLSIRRWAVVVSAGLTRLKELADDPLLISNAVNCGINCVSNLVFLLLGLLALLMLPVIPLIVLGWIFRPFVRYSLHP